MDALPAEDLATYVLLQANDRGKWAVLTRERSGNWTWLEGRTYDFVEVERSPALLVIHDPSRDVYHRLFLDTGKSAWHLGPNGEMNPYYPIIVSDSSPSPGSGNASQPFVTYVVVGEGSELSQYRRRQDGVWTWDEPGVSDTLEEIRRTATRVLLYNRTRDLYFRFHLDSATSFWTVGTFGDWREQRIVHFQ
jgi:hypothetical protein